jgi:Tfp pilus assembly PilM family ATPase
MLLESGLDDNVRAKKINDEIARFAPFDPGDILGDYHIAEDDGKNMRIHYIGASRSLLESYVKILRKVGIDPTSIDMELSSIGKSLLIREKDAKHTLIVDIGSKVTAIGVFDTKGCLTCSTSVAHGGYHLTRAIMEYKNIGEQEAENSKRMYGLDGSKLGNDIETVLEKSLTRTLQEASKLMAYYTQETGARVEQMLLSGGSSAISAIDLFFSESLRVPVVRRDPLGAILPSSEIDRSEAMFYAGVIGAGLLNLEDWVGNVNLLKWDNYSIRYSAKEKFLKALKGLITQNVYYILGLLWIVAIVLIMIVVVFIVENTK